MTRSCFDCQHHAVCTWRQANHKGSLSFIDARDIAKLHEIYQIMASACVHFLGTQDEPHFKENWFKIAKKTYDDEVINLIADGMPEENARHVAFREAVLSAIQSESFLTLARQVPILEAKIEELTRQI